MLLEAKDSSEAFVVECVESHHLLRTSGRNPASEISPPMREWKVKTSVSVHISAHRNMQPPVVVICGTTCVEMPYRKCKPTVANCRGPCSRGLADLSAAGPGVASCQRGLVPQRTGYTPYLRGPSTDIWRCRRWETRRIAGRDWRLRKRHCYRSIITPRAKQIPQRSAPKSGLGCFERSNGLWFRWFLSPGRRGQIARRSVVSFLPRFELYHWGFRGTRGKGGGIHQ